MSKPTIPNSHTRMFTRVPNSVTKEWTTKCISLANKQELDHETNNHEESLINSIKLNVEFNSVLQHDTDTVDDDDDSTAHLIDGWQEARKEWAELESSLEDAIKHFTDRHWTRAVDQRTKSIDILNKSRTSYKCNTVDKTNSHSLCQLRVNDKPTSCGNKPRTIHPSESASSVSVNSRHTLQSHSSNRTARRVTPFMLYAAGLKRR